MALFTDEELKILEILEDPIKWAEATLSLRDGPFQSRWYQTEVANHIIGKDKEENTSGIHNRVVLRWGRRMGKTTIMAVILLWYTFTHNNGKVVVAAPYETQVALIFKMVREFIKESPTLADSVARDIKSPHYIEFKNGATIAGFTSGVRSGAKGDSMRGQAADWIIMDEMDRMGDDDIDSISAIALEDADRIGIIASSTPTGRRGKFWGFCNTPEIWWQSHRPSWNNPTWSERTEKEFRSMLSEQGYIHEVEAEFGEETTGVFRKEHIERAKYDYQYPEKATGIAHRIMGVDWDKYQATPQIVITEFVPEFIDHTGRPTPKFKVVFRADIPESEFTLDNAVKEIIRLNDKFDPDFIYCDRGFGEYQIELLRKHGLKHPETGLNEKVKGISFSQKIPIRDPATKEIDNKDIKPFMVNQTVILMERDEVALNKNDELLWKQMQNYQVLKTTVYGRPIYTSEDEHTLDAFMLSILGFTIELPNITKILQEFIVARTVAVAPKFDRIFHHEDPEKKDEFWDPTDPDETSYRYLKRDQVKTYSGIPGSSTTTNTTRVTSWSPRGNSFGKTPKKRGW